VNASVTYLRRAPEMDGENQQGWKAHVLSCPPGPHTHHVWAPWPEGQGQVNLSTQAGFALHGMEKMATRWDVPWFVTVVH
jgi:hypothetical protein